MNKKWLVVSGLAVAALIYWKTRPDDAPPEEQRSASRKVQTGERIEEKEELPEADGVKMVLTESGWQAETPRRQPREWKDPNTGRIDREIIDAYPDPKRAAAEELQYRVSRLQFSLVDAAQDCWQGPASDQEIELEYSLVVQAGVLRAEAVRIKQNTIADGNVANCIVNAARDMRMSVNRIPDMRQDQTMAISLASIAERHRRDKANREADEEAAKSN